MESSNRKPLFWIILVVGIIAVTSFSWLVGSFAGSLWNKGRETAAARGEIPAKSDVNAREQNIQKANTFDTKTGRNAKDEDSTRGRDRKRDGEDTTGRDVRLPDQTTTIGNPDDILGTPQKPATGDKTLDTDAPANKPAPDATPAPQPDKTASPPGPQSSTGSKFRVQIGSSITDAQKAASLATEASAKSGLNCGKIKDASSGKYRVQCGVFSQKDKASSVARELELNGYKVYVAETK